MYYEKKITTANTYTQQIPLETTLKATAGVITWVEIEFPPKGAYSVGVSIWLGSHPIVPVNASDWVYSDGHTVEFREWIELKALLNDITIRTYNISESHSHDVVVRFTVLKDWQVTPWLSVNRLIKQVKILLGKLGGG